MKAAQLPKDDMRMGAAAESRSTYLRSRGDVILEVFASASRNSLGLPTASPVSILSDFEHA